MFWHSEVLWWMPCCNSVAAALQSCPWHAFLMLRGNFSKGEISFREAVRRGGGVWLTSLQQNMILVREIIIPTPFEGTEEHWPVASSMALPCLGKHWSKPGEQNMVIPNGKAHVWFVRYRGESVARNGFQWLQYTYLELRLAAHLWLSDTLVVYLQFILPVCWWHCSCLHKVLSCNIQPALAFPWQMS